MVCWLVLLMNSSPSRSAIVARAIATSKARAVLHRAVVQGPRPYGVPWVHIVTRQSQLITRVTRCSLAPGNLLRVLGTIRIVRGTPVGLENALERHVIIRSAAHLITAKLPICDVPFMPLIGGIWGV